MKRLSPLPRKRGRLEIIPLIDIMFFLLAAFMVVSINKIRINSLKINLPTNVPTTVKVDKEDFVSISINTEGQVQIDKQLITTKEELTQRLRDLYAQNKEQKILISADRDTHHGDVMSALSKIRQAGFQKVAFAIKAEGAPVGGAPDGASAPDSVTAPDSASPAAAPPAPAAPAAPAPVTPEAAAPAPSAPPAPPSPPASSPSPPAGP